MKKRENPEIKIQKAYRNYVDSWPFTPEPSPYDCFKSGFIAGVISTIKFRVEKVKLNEATPILSDQERLKG